MITYDSRSIKLIAAAFLAILSIFIVGHFYLSTRNDADAAWYIKIATGDIKDAVQPFASRVLHPWLVSFFSSLSGLGIDASFYVTNVFLLFCFVLIVSLFFSEISFANPVLIFTIIFTPFILELSRRFYLSDVLYFFLAALFLLSIKRKRMILGLSLLFLMFLSRPSDTVILGVIFIAVSFFKKENKLAYGGMAVVLAGYLLSFLVIVPMGAANIHNISNFIYRALEPIYYFVRSVLGVDWFMSSQVHYCQPQLTLSVPHWLHLGNIQWVGICGFNISNPLYFIFYLLATFGVIPVILFFILPRFVFRKNWKSLFAENEVWTLTALIYGTFMFFIGSLVPNLRTVSYGWPAMWIASLFIFDRYLKQFPQAVKSGVAKTFALGQAVSSWIPYLVVINYPNPMTLFLAIIFVLAVYLVFFKRISYLLTKRQA